MNNEPSDKQVELILQTDKDVIKQETAGSRIVEINITAPEKKSETERAPLNISLVLDHSGSMSGEKLQFVKQAAAHVIDLLDEKDRASVVVYDDKVDTIVPHGNVTEAYKKEARSSIHMVRSGSSTFLSGGWLKGCELVATGDDGNSINRTLLLTDGLANVGIRNAIELASHASELFQRGITTSCFGVGLDYDEHLLEAMANSGGGNFHFLETVNAIPTVFEREFTELVTITLRDVVVSVKAPEGVSIDVLGGWSTEVKKGRVDISLGNLYASQNKKLYFRLNHDQIKPGTEITLTVTIRGKGDEDNILELTKSLVFKAVSLDEEESAQANEQLLQRYAEFDMAGQVNEALKRERAGDRRGASQTIRVSINRNRPHLSPIILDKYESIANEALIGMNEIQHKRYHRDRYERLQSRELYRDYRLDMVNGHLITNIEGQSVLIDTGSPISIGKREEFYFSNNFHRLSREYLGVTMDYLEKMVGTDIDILLGMDILKNQCLTIHLPQKRVHFSQMPMIRTRYSVPMENFMGVPSVIVNVSGLEQKMYVDTGAKLTYVDKEIAAPYSSMGKTKDFYPGLGEFETETYEIPSSLGDLRLTLHCGVLPDVLETTLKVTGNHGILGTEIFHEHLVCLAFPMKTLLMERIR